MTTGVWLLALPLAATIAALLGYWAAGVNGDRASAAGALWHLLRRALRLVIPTCCLLAAAAPVVALLVLAIRADTGEEWWAQAIAAASLMSATLLLFATGPRRYTTLEAIGTQPEPGERFAEHAYAPDTVLSSKQFKALNRDKAKVRMQRGLFFRALYVGLDGRWSTSKLQVLLWTYVIAYALLALFVGDQLGLDLVDPRDERGPVPPAAIPEKAPAGDGHEFSDLEFREEYMLLLGGPFAAAIGAKALTQRKIENGELDKPPAEAKPSATEGAQQIVSDDDGRTDIIDLQYFLFNLIALAVFLVSFVPAVKDGLPEIPTFLAALTSASALTYVGKKAVERSTPTVISLVPRRLAPGDSLTIAGQHLLGASDQNPTVTVAGLEVKTFEILRRPRATTDFAKLRFRVPPSAVPGTDVEVVISAAGSAAATLRVDLIGPPKIRVVDPTPLTLAPGVPVTITGEGFGPKDSAAKVTLADVRLPEGSLKDVDLAIADWRDDQIVAVVPDPAPPLPVGAASALAIKITTAEGTTGGSPITVAAPAMTIADISPQPLPLTADTRLIVTGSGFGAGQPKPLVTLDDMSLLVLDGRLDTLMVCELEPSVSTLAARTVGDTQTSFRIDRDGWAPVAKPVTVTPSGP